MPTNEGHTFDARNTSISVENLDILLQEFLENEEKKNITDQCVKCAYVVPVFEISDEVATLPKDKIKLQYLVKNKLAR
jgi:hypothetical protein